jgi:PTH1 family peptidyl-tRNA hydrolase
MAVDELARKNNLDLGKSRFDAEYINYKFKQNKIFLVKPQSYMNKSGFPIQKLASYFKIDIQNIIIIHDDIDLVFGRIRISKDRGPGGHNGIRSIINCFGTKNFIRIRLGIANPDLKNSVTGHVLGSFSKEETKLLDGLVDKGADAAISIIDKGISFAMNLYN